MQSGCDDWTFRKRHWATKKWIVKTREQNHYNYEEKKTWQMELSIIYTISKYYEFFCSLSERIYII